MTPYDVAGILETSKMLLVFFAVHSTQMGYIDGCKNLKVEDSTDPKDDWMVKNDKF